MATPKMKYAVAGRRATILQMTTLFASSSRSRNLTLISLLIKCMMTLSAPGDCQSFCKKVGCAQVGCGICCRLSLLRPKGLEYRQSFSDSGEELHYLDGTSRHQSARVEMGENKKSRKIVMFDSQVSLESKGHKGLEKEKEKHSRI